MNLVRRIPWLPLMLWAIWLLLNDTLSLGHVLLGGVLAFALDWWTRAMRPLRASPRRIGIALVLWWHVVLDVVRSNFAVARIVLGLSGHQVTSGFMRVPLDMRDPHGLALLSCILTATPGSVWTDLRDDGTLILHVLDLQNEEAWIRLIKDRYERPLMEIFE